MKHPKIPFIRSRAAIPAMLVIALAAGIVAAQRFGGFGGFGGGRRSRSDLETVRTAREYPQGSTETPNWTNTPGFEKDVFTFARIRCDREGGGYGYGRGGGGEWHTDFPDSDLNLSFRLQQMTSMKVDPDGRVINLTDPELVHYPWIYMVEPGRLLLKDEEIPVLRRYLLNGGVLMADDFWGERQWEGFHREMKRVFPDREFKDLSVEHPIFHSVFDIKVPKNKLQVPSIRAAERGYDPATSTFYITGEGGEDTREVHVRAITDDKGRIMVIATHNTDNGDGWEREGENHAYFQTFSEQRAYPLGINILFYIMTH